MAKTNSEGTRQFPFGKVMLASGIGTLIVLAVMFFLKMGVFVTMIAALSGDSATGGTPMREDGFLRVDLTKAMDERTPSTLNLLMVQGSELGFSDLGRTLRAAATNDKVQGIYLYMGSDFPYSWGMSTELRQMIEDFRTSGKPVFAYANSYSQQAYYVASAADSVFLNPAGMMSFTGIGAEAMYYKELLDRLDVHMSLIRPKSNSYKSAGETYTTTRMSDANREQVRTYISSLWNYVLKQMSESRNIPVDELNRLADNLLACTPNDALKAGLVDRLVFEADVKSTIETLCGNAKTTNLEDYAKSLLPTKQTASQIAIIYAQGDVVDGTGYRPAVYSDKITQALDDAAADEKVKAIVLRVNSPGGMVTASEIMTNAVARAREHKPVVVSMSDVAASAGYEISCNASCIVAQPTTITGSIGVFATVPEIGATLHRHIGITTDTVKTNANSTSMSILRPMAPEMVDLLQRNVEEFYQTFVTRVANGRSLSYDFVDSIARGHVWTGIDALGLGLVDTLGGLETAIAIAANLADVEEYQVVDYPANKSFYEELMEISSGSNAFYQRANMPRKQAEMQMSALQTNLMGAAIPTMNDGVWTPGSLVGDVLKRIMETRGLQARVEFLLVNE